MSHLTLKAHRVHRVPLSPRAARDPRGRACHRDADDAFRCSLAGRQGSRFPTWAFLMLLRRMDRHRQGPYTFGASRLAIAARLDSGSLAYIAASSFG
jgi:hypothetical protein